MTASVQKRPPHLPDFRTHIPALDGVRGLAILLVMLHHFTFYGGMGRTVFVDRLLYTVSMAGWCGVDLFFVLSGFLITGILLDAKGSEYFFRNFYMRRSLRIFPLYYGFLVVFFVILPLVVPLGSKFEGLFKEQGWYWSYLVNVAIAKEGWPPFYAIAHFWSLAVEEQFYLCWPLVIFVCRQRHLLMICLAFIVGSLGIRLGLVLGGQPLAAYVLTPARMDALAVGALLALIARRPSGFSGVLPWVWHVIGGSALALAAIFLWQRGLSAVDAVVQTIGYTLLAVLFGAILVVAVTAPPATFLGRVFAHRGLVFFGHYSYALYVFHHPIAIFMRKAGFRADGLPTVMESQLPGQLLFMLVATIISLSLALLSWHLYESQFLKLKSLFPYESNLRRQRIDRYEVNPVPNS
jgi:peptidoglycan/LPS O-acetylase OafA/YrhL